MKKLVFLLGMFLFIGCTAMNYKLNNKVWTLQTINEKPVKGQITIKFDGQKVGGRASINRYFGAYEIKDDTITFKPMATTLMAGPKDLMDEEFMYLKELSKVNTFIIKENVLELKSVDSTLKFIKN